MLITAPYDLFFFRLLMRRQIKKKKKDPVDFDLRANFLKPAQ